MGIYKKSSPRLSSNFFQIALATGVLFGITYGACILINEAKSLSKKEIIFVAVFLSILHSAIEDPLLFAIYKASFTQIVIFRLIWAIIFSIIAIKFYKKIKLK